MVTIEVQERGSSVLLYQFMLFLEYEGGGERSQFDGWDSYKSRKSSRFLVHTARVGPVFNTLRLESKDALSVFTF